MKGTLCKCKKVTYVAHVGHAVDAVDAVRSEIVVYGGEDIVFGAKTSNQWMQYAGTQWNSGIWWWGHLSLVQKGQTRGRSGSSMHWMQYAVE